MSDIPDGGGGTSNRLMENAIEVNRYMNSHSPILPQENHKRPTEDPQASSDFSRGEGDGAADVVADSPMPDECNLRSE
jgi:hypothetical protein